LATRHDRFKVVIIAYWLSASVDALATFIGIGAKVALEANPLFASMAVPHDPAQFVIGSALTTALSMAWVVIGGAMVGLSKREWVLDAMALMLSLGISMHLLAVLAWLSLILA
jgi:hypothetical protein